MAAAAKRIKTIVKGATAVTATLEKKNEPPHSTDRSNSNAHSARDMVVEPFIADLAACRRMTLAITRASVWPESDLILCRARGSCYTMRMSRDEEVAWERAWLARDPAFDGRFFIGVRTTGVYCRCVCPVRLPYRRNVEFMPSAAAADGVPTRGVGAELLGGLDRRVRLR